MVILCYDFLGENSSWFWTMMQFFLYVVTFFVVLIQLHEQNQQKKIQNEQLKDQVNINIVTILNSLNEQWWSTRMRRARRKICFNHKANSINVDEEAVLSFFENIGLYCERKMIDPELIWETYSYYIERYWLILKTNIETIQSKDQTYFDGFVRLKDLMDSISKLKGINKVNISVAELIDFIESEKLCYTPKAV